MDIVNTSQGSERKRRLAPGVALLILALLGCVHVVNAMDRIVFPVLLPKIRGDFGLSLEAGGLLATSFALGVGLSGLITGTVIDHLSRKGAIVSGLVVFSALTLLCAFAAGFYDMAAYRAFSGLGEGIQTAALFTAVGAYFTANRAAAVGAMNFAFGIGSFVGPSLAASIFLHTGNWRTPFLVYGLLGLALAVLVLAVVPRCFTDAQADTKAGLSRRHMTRERMMLPAGLLHRNILICGISAVALGLAGYGFVGLYPTFLQAQLGFTVAQAGLAASLFGVGALFGIPAGYLADRISQKAIAIVATVALMAVSYIMFNLATTPATQYLLAILFGICGSGVLAVNIFSLTQRCVRPDYAGRATGFLMACLYLPASVAGYLFAVLRTNFGWGDAALLQLVVVPAISVIAMLFLDERAVD